MNIEMRPVQSTTGIRIAGNYRWLRPQDCDELAAHFCDLDAVDRRQRFCGGMSDEAVTAYVRGIDWAWHLAIAFAPAGRIAVVAEVVASSRKGWSHAEFVASRAVSSIPQQVQAELLQIALLQAHDSGCRTVEMSPAWASLLRASPAGAGRHFGEDVVVDLDGWFGRRPSASPLMRVEGLLPAQGAVLPAPRASSQ